MKEFKQRYWCVTVKCFRERGKWIVWVLNKFPFLSLDIFLWRLTKIWINHLVNGTQGRELAIKRPLPTFKSQKLKKWPLSHLIRDWRVIQIFIYNSVWTFFLINKFKSDRPCWRTMPRKNQYSFSFYPLLLNGLSNAASHINQCDKYLFLDSFWKNISFLF